jgi:hypothetical protein
METGGFDVTGVLLQNQESSFKLSGRKLSQSQTEQRWYSRGMFTESKSLCSIWNDIKTRQEMYL